MCQQTSLQPRVLSLSYINPSSHLVLTVNDLFQFLLPENCLGWLVVSKMVFRIILSKHLFCYSSTAGSSILRQEECYLEGPYVFVFVFFFFFFLCLPSDFLFHQCGTCCIGSHTVCCVLDQEWFLIILLMSEFCMYPDLWKVLNLPTSARSRIAHMCMIWNMFPWSLFLSNWAATSRCNIELVAKFTDKMECGNLNSVNFKA